MPEDCFLLYPAFVKGLPHGEETIQNRLYRIPFVRQPRSVTVPAAYSSNYP